MVKVMSAKNPPVGLKGCLHYDPLTGVFTWKYTINRNAKKGQIAGRKNSGYIEISIDGVKYLAHRLAWYYMTGEWPDVIDHDNRIKDDNRWVNLKNGSHASNSRNQNGVIIFEIDGVSKPMKEWCEIYGKNPNRVYHRYKAHSMGPKESLEI